MTRVPSTNESRLTELLAGQALGDLSDVEIRELESLVRPGEHERLGEELEYTAAMIDQLLPKSRPGDRSTVPDGMPHETRRKIVEQAYLSIAALTVGSPSVASEPLKLRESDAQVQPAAPLHRGWRWREIVAWLACATCLLVAVGIWQRQSPAPLVPPNPVAARADLLRDDPQALQASFGPGKTPFDGDVQGDVVWSTRLQKGYLRLRDVPVNDPTREQYQLWIIDPERDDEPIDGGVFNIAASGEAIIPIDAKLQVLSPQAFAITIEKPGGVVVSTQERLPLLALVAN